jgi:hypothetical protein
MRLPNVLFIYITQFLLPDHIARSTSYKSCVAHVPLPYTSGLQFHPFQVLKAQRVLQAHTALAMAEFASMARVCRQWRLGTICSNDTTYWLQAVRVVYPFARAAPLLPSAQYCTPTDAINSSSYLPTSSSSSTSPTSTPSTLAMGGAWQRLYSRRAARIFQSEFDCLSQPCHGNILTYLIHPYPCHLTICCAYMV